MRGFREVGWVAAVAGTALGCYMVSLKVASERAALEEVQNRIVMAQRDIRVLQTEIGTRGRLEQLESWNVKVLALSAPQAHQFLEGEFQLATLAAPSRAVDPAAPVVLASAPNGPAGSEPVARVEREEGRGQTARDLMQVASLKRDLPAVLEKSVDKREAAEPKPVKTAAKAATAAPKAADAKAATSRAEAVRTAPAKATAKAVPPTTAKATAGSAKPPAVSSKSRDSKARQ